LNIDDQVALGAQLEDDDKGVSWVTACGKNSKTTLYNAPEFVQYNKDDLLILVKPIELSHVGLFIVGV
jgi:hypothetical protein